MAKSAKQAAQELATECGAGVNEAKVLPFKFKVKKLVTVPALTVKMGKPYYLRFDSEIRLSDVKTKTADGKEKKPAHVANVTDLETGEQFLLLLQSVVMENLVRQYPEESYVGKSFEIENFGKAQGKDYFKMTIKEVEIE